MSLNDRVILTLDYGKKVMAEEVLHNNDGKKVTILPVEPVPPKDIATNEMIPITHKTCGHVAFYYTHVPCRGEMMRATNARDLKGRTIETNSTMRCGSCGEPISGPKDMQVRRKDHEARYGKN